MSFQANTFSDCIVCRRINPKDVFRVGHQLYNGKLSKQEIHEICVFAVKTINYVDSKRRIFFCGRPEAPLLAGLYYIYGLMHPEAHISQREIAEKLGVYQTSVRINYVYWWKAFPELFFLSN